MKTPKIWLQVDASVECWLECPAMTQQTQFDSWHGQLARSSPSCLSSLSWWSLNGYLGKINCGNPRFHMCPRVIGSYLPQAQRAIGLEMSTAATCSYCVCTHLYLHTLYMKVLGERDGVLGQLNLTVPPWFLCLTIT